MYQLLCRSSERPWGNPAVEPDSLSHYQADTVRPLILHMQENRSRLPQEARAVVAVLALLFMVTTITPALKGQWLVPAFSLLAMAALTFALERHAKSRPASETLEVAEGRVRHRDSLGRTAEYPAFWMRLAAEGRGPTELRLFLKSRDGVIEFGRCLSLDERLEVVPMVAAALAATRGG